MKIDIHISDKFKIYDGLYVLGNVYVDGERFDLNQKENAMSLFEDLEIKVLSGKLNGNYSIIVQQDKVLTVITSPDQYHPVFYSYNDDGLSISDEFSKLKNDQLLKGASEELMAFGFVLGNRTLNKNLFCCKGGTITTLKPDGVEEERFFNYCVQSNDIWTISEKETYDLGVQKLNNVFNRIVEALNGKTAVIPLSGGYDSRIIAAQLVRSGYKKIIAFTYGIPGNPEARLAEQVVKQLKIQWYNIEYTNEFIHQYDDFDLFSEYVDYAFNGRSSAHLQDFYAVLYLKKKGLIPEDSIFIPGHSGDALGGSQLVKVVNPQIPINDVARLYHVKKANLCKLPSESEKDILKSISDRVETLYSDKCLGYSVFEDIDVQEKLSKFTLNSAKIYNFFGYECLFPYWDMELIEFWRKVQVTEKINKTFFNRIVENELFRPMNLMFEGEMQPALWRVYLQICKEYIKPFLPVSIKRHYIKKNDIVNYQQLSSPFMEFIKNVEPDFTYEHNNLNSIIPKYIVLKNR